jgi:hypothetical protein
VKLALRIGGFALAMGILAVIVERIGVHALLDQLRLVGPGFLWILAIHAVALVVAAIPWWLLLPPERRPSLGGAIASRIFASGANAVLPLFGLGGELVRLVWLRKHDRASGLAAIVVDRLMYGVASATLLAAGLVGLLHLPALPDDYARTATIGVAVLLVMSAVGSAVALRGGMGTRIHRLVGRVRKHVDHETQFGDDVDRHMSAMLRLRSSAPWLAWLLHATARGLIGSQIVLGFYLLGAPLAWDEALVFAALPVILALAGAIVPSQLGVHEGAQALVATSLGISPTTAVAVVLLMRLRQVLSAAVIGPMLLVRRRRLPPVEELAEAAREDEPRRASETGALVQP